MFGNKQVKGNEITKKPITVTTIPTEFYAGTNPVVKFKTVEKEIDVHRGPSLSNVDKRLLDKETAVGSNEPLHPVNIFSNRRFLLLGGVFIFVLILIGGGAYYLIFGHRSPRPRPPLSNTTTPPVEINTSTPTSSIEITPTTSPQLNTSSTFSESLIDFPSVTLGDSVDTDNDGLTDKEEELFSTDLGVPDTDNDGYSDGHEVYYLYNPAGKEPMRIIDSGTVKEFMNPVFGYKLYYPITWALGNVDQDYRDVLFSTLTGEHVEVRVFDKRPNEDFSAWFARSAPREKYDDLVEFSNYFKYSGLSRKDGLVYYFESQDKIYVLVFHTTDSQVVNYRSVIKMMARSFRVPGRALVPSPEIIPNSSSTNPFSTSSPDVHLKSSSITATSTITSTPIL